MTKEGAALPLAEKRTATYANRKIVCGSSPVYEATSTICRLYAESDRLVYMTPCPLCGAMSEIVWQAIEWPEGEPDKAPRCRRRGR